MADTTIMWEDLPHNRHRVAFRPEGSRIMGCTCGWTAKHRLVRPTLFTAIDEFRAHLLTSTTEADRGESLYRDPSSDRAAPVDRWPLNAFLAAVEYEVNSTQGAYDMANVGSAFCAVRERWEAHRTYEGIVAQVPTKQTIISTVLAMPPQEAHSFVAALMDRVRDTALYGIDVSMLPQQDVDPYAMEAGGEPEPPSTDYPYRIRVLLSTLRQVTDRTKVGWMVEGLLDLLEEQFVAAFGR